MESEYILPTPQEYIVAITRLEPRITENQRNLLRAHLHSNDHTTTTTELAKAIGSTTFRAVNLIYGNLGARMREELHWSGPGQKSAIIASFKKYGSTDWLWVMHRPLAEALASFPWARDKGSMTA